MGRLDAFDVGDKKLTIQTEFFPRPAWRIETKVYLAGALKKVYTDEVPAEAAAGLQQRVDRFHEAKMEELATQLRNRKS